ncbi:LD-carboxypeptidase, partial [Clostridium perfringens]|nr:LD-carboxypeptidase [Clostridium perfringens]
GNLSIICSTIGTPYEIDFKGNILFIEDVDESPYSVDRMLSQLISCGKLQKVCGIILGHFTDCTNKDSDFSINDIIKQKLVPLNIPIIESFPLGHDYPNITIPIGAKFEFLSSSNLLMQKKLFFK